MLRWCSVNCGDAKCMHRTNRANNMKTHLSRLVESKQISTLQPNKKTNIIAMIFVNFWPK